jgi:hypothetical protein
LKSGAAVSSDNQPFTIVYCFLRISTSLCTIAVDYFIYSVRESVALLLWVTIGFLVSKLRLIIDPEVDVMFFLRVCFLLLVISLVRLQIIDESPAPGVSEYSNQFANLNPIPKRVKIKSSTVFEECCSTPE